MVVYTTRYTDIDMAKRIDSHHHVWELARGDYDWLTPDYSPKLLHDFGPQDMTSLMADCNMQASVLVECARTLAETRYMLAVAEKTDFIEAVVGWVDIARADAIDTLAEFAENPLFRGIRPMMLDFEDLTWLTGENQRRALGEMSRLGLVFDALVLPSHLDDLRDAMIKFADLPVVINHFGYPDIASGDIGGWQNSMAAIARDTSASVKFSGIMVGLGADRPVADFRLAADHLLEHFGPQRLMWGSDWPHLLADSDYLAWYALGERLLEGTSEADRTSIYGGTAAEVYRI